MFFFSNVNRGECFDKLSSGQSKLDLLDFETNFYREKVKRQAFKDS